MSRATKKDRDWRNRQRRKMATVTKEAIASKVDKLDDMLEGLDDGWDHIRKAMIGLAADRSEWAGYPLPIHHQKLVVEPTHPLASGLNGFSLAADEEKIEREDGLEVVNAWIDRRGWTIFVVRTREGRIEQRVWPRNPDACRLTYVLDTLGASQAWSAAAEMTAMATLKTLVTKTAFRYYILTGSFLETSPRSKVTYLFRKGRPTVAMSFGTGYMKALCALCLHPIGYYENTFAGSMVPTDDVIAHLQFMRADEAKFWAKANQHQLKDPTSGV